MKPPRAAAVIVTIGFSMFVASIAPAQLKSPEGVKTALKRLLKESDDFKKHIAAKSFARLPQEYTEYMVAADALRSAVKDEPTDFKRKVETRLDTAVEAYKKVSDMSADVHDSDRLMDQYGAAVTATDAVFELFPSDLRPDPERSNGAAPN